jgi:hypothetical protein
MLVSEKLPFFQVHFDELPFDKLLNFYKLLSYVCAALGKVFQNVIEILSFWVKRFLNEELFQALLKLWIKAVLLLLKER